MIGLQQISRPSSRQSPHRQNQHSQRPHSLSPHSLSQHSLSPCSESPRRQSLCTSHNYEAEAAAFSPGGTALDGYSPYEPESIAECVHARHAPPEPESIGGRVHVRHAVACVMGDAGDEEMPCMF